jgi:glycosyltransferase involved in cell wall biosynthesis
LSDAIKSILEQTFTDFELIIINDGSTDNSLKLIESFKDPRIIIINHKSNKGLASSLNEGISVCKGQYIARMDDDDISTPDRFAKQVVIFEDESVGMVCSNTISIDKKGNEISSPWWQASDKAVNDDLLWTNPVVHPSVMIRRSHMQKYHDLAGAEDYDLWTRISKNKKSLE